MLFGFLAFLINLQVMINKYNSKLFFGSNDSSEEQTTIKSHLNIPLKGIVKVWQVFWNLAPVCMYHWFRQSCKVAQSDFPLR